jgi:hypothetical protein
MIHPRVLLMSLLSIPFGLDAGEVYSPRPLGSTPAPYGYLEYLPPGFQAKGRAKHALVKPCERGAPASPIPCTLGAGSPSAHHVDHRILTPS